MTTLITLLILTAGNPSPPPDASPLRRGLVNTGTQTFGGQKTFVDGGIVTESLTLSSSSSDAGFSVVTATNAAMTLYVDLDGGNDSSACTGGDGGVCLTIDGALAKVPHFVAHDVIVSVGSGVYAPVTLPSLFITESASLAFVGPPLIAAVFPDGGASSGTLLSYTATTYPVKTAVADASAQWPVKWSADDRLFIRGLFVEVTGGTGDGGVAVVFESEGPTTLRTSTFSAVPAAGSTYAIRQPAAVIQSTTATPAVSLVGGSGRVTFTRILFDSTTVTGGTGACLSLGSSVAGSASGRFLVSLTNSICRFALPTSGIAVFGANSLSLTRSSLVQRNNISSMLPLTQSTGASGRISVSTSYVFSGGQAFSVGGASSAITSSQMDVMRITPGNIGAYIGGTHTTTSSWFVCHSRPEEGTFFGGATALNAARTTLQAFNLSVDGCGIGIALAAASLTVSGGVFEATNVNPALYLSQGAVISLTQKSTAWLPGATISLSNVNDGGYHYLLGQQEVSDTTLAAMPDGGQFVESFHGVIFRR